MAIPINTCQAEVLGLGALQLAFPLAPGTTIQFQIGLTPITGVVNIGGAIDVNAINNAIALDPTYLSSGTTISVSFVGDSIIASISKPSTTQITDSASFAIIYPPLPFVDFSGVGLFVCNLAPASSRRRRRTLGTLPMICIDNNGKRICYMITKRI